MRRGVRLVALTGIAAATLSLWVMTSLRPAPDGVPHRPNVILVSIDTLRADHLGCYGYSRPTSPFLDRLARDGVVFEKAFAQASWTLPSHMSLMSSRYPHNHGVETFDVALSESVVTLPMVLQDHGYATAGFVTNLYVSTRYGFDRGFDHFVELLPRQDDSFAQSVPAGEVVDRVLEWTAQPRDRPWFLFVHLFDPHLDYAPPIEMARIFDPDLTDASIGRYEFLNRYMKGLSEKSERIDADVLHRVVALYDGEIRYTDRELERMFRAISDRGLLDDTLVIVTSDHGEELNEHGSMEGHQWTLYDEVIRVPLIVRLPRGAHAGRRVSSLTELIDVAPMVLSFLGVPAPAGFEGRDPFDGGAAGMTGAAREHTFSEIKRFTFKWAVRTDRHKVVYTADTGPNPFGVPTRQDVELYDLAADPGEQRNIADDDRPSTQALLDVLRGWQSRTAPPSSVPAAELSPSDVEQLRALGYLNR